MKRSELFFSVLLVPLDYVMLLLAGLVTYLLRTRILDAFRPVLFEQRLSFNQYILTVAVVALVFIVVYAFSGLYALRSTRRFLAELGRIAIASSAGLMAMIVFIFLRAQLFNSRFLVLGAWILAIFFVSLGRWGMRQIQRYLASKHGFGVHNVLVIGDDDITRVLIEGMESDRGAGYRIVKRLSHPELSEVRQVASMIDEVILANPNYPSERVIELIEFCHEEHLGFRFVPNLYQTLTKNYSFDTYTGVPFVELKRTTLDGWGRVFKRLLDFSGSLVGLIILLPIFAVIAVVIKLDSSGPVFYKARRVSRGKEFGLLKFRSMVVGADSKKASLEAMNERNGSPLFKMRNDPRVTKVGKFLRRYRLDEFPGLWNVLKGDVSLIGPRPHEPQEIAKYEKHHRRVLSIKSGVSGMAQVSGSSDLPFDEEVALDTFYIENWSLWLDLKIIILTLLKLARDRSAV